LAVGLTVVPIGFLWMNHLGAGAPLIGDMRPPLVADGKPRSYISIRLVARTRHYDLKGGHRLRCAAPDGRLLASTGALSDVDAFREGAARRTVHRTADELQNLVS